MRISRAATIALALSLAVGIAGCGSGSPEAASPSNGSSTTPSAEPTQARETGLVAPKQVFGGDCANLYTADEISQIVGLPVVEGDSGSMYGIPDISVELHGGIRCSWSAAEYAASVYLVALPEAAVTYGAPSGCEPDNGLYYPGCTLEKVAGGIRLSGRVSTIDSDLTALAAYQTALLSLFEQRATPENYAPLPIPAAGAWRYPVDCASVVAAADLSAVPGLGAGTEGGQTGGSDAYFPPAEFALWGAFTPPYCTMYKGDVYVDFQAFGGGRYMESTIAALPGAASLAIDGIESAITVPTGYDDRTVVHVFSGPNWLHFTVKFTKNAAPIAKALIASLDATATP